MKNLTLFLAFTLIQTTLAATETPDAHFQSVADTFLKERYRMHPTTATQLGIHDYDDRLENLSSGGIQQEVVFLHSAEKQVSAIPAATLTQPSSIDRDLLLNSIRAALLDLENVRTWEKNPDFYNSLLSLSIFTLISRTFAPIEDRLRSVIAREKQIPTLLANARSNLKNPPKEYIDLTLENLPGTILFFKNDVPAAFKSVGNQALLADFKAVNAAAVESVENFHRYLKEDLAQQAKGDFRLGEELFLRKLALEELIDTPAEKLLELGTKNLRDNQNEFRKTAAKVDSKKSPEEILAVLMKDHPPSKGVIGAFRARMLESKKFIEDHHIVTIPSKILPLLRETPGFERAIYFASLDAPGPFETKAHEAYFNVTLPEPAWSPQRIEENLQGFNRGTILSTAVHEAYPGHYLQFLWVPRVTSSVRKVFGVNSNIEGWAHYTEQMMLDEGLGGHNPKLKLGQLQDALLRNARFIVGLQMHRGKMTFNEAVEFFVKEGYQTRAVAVTETRRGTADPTYLYYTAGKLAIQKLREDFEKEQGAKYTLRGFHDRFLAEGPIPIPLMRKAMLKDARGLFKF